MRIKQVRYLRRKNLGNYQHEEVELSAELDREDNIETVIAQLKKDARVALNIPDPSGEPVF